MLKLWHFTGNMLSVTSVVPPAIMSLKPRVSWSVFLLSRQIMNLEHITHLQLSSKNDSNKLGIMTSRYQVCLGKSVVMQINYKALVEFKRKVPDPEDATLVACGKLKRGLY